MKQLHHTSDFFLSLATFLIIIIFSISLHAVNTPVKNYSEIVKEYPGNITPKNKDRAVISSQKNISREKKKKKNGWLKKLFSKNKNSEKDRKIFRIMKKVLLWSVLVFVPSIILLTAALSNEHTFVGSLYEVLIALSAISLYIGLFSLLLVIILGLKLKFSKGSGTVQ